MDAAGTAKTVRVLFNTSYNNGRAGGIAPELRGIHMMGSAADSGNIEGLYVTGNRCYDNQVSPTQVYGLSLKENITYGHIYENDLRGNLTSAILYDVTNDSTLKFYSNDGIDDLLTKTANYTLTSLDKVILADTTAADRTMTLPTAVGREDERFKIKKIVSANTLTIATTSSQTIDGSTTYTITNQYTGITVISDVPTGA